MRLFVGDDWAEDHHDVELMDVAGRVLARAKLPEGVAGMTRLHAVVAGQFGDADPDEVHPTKPQATTQNPIIEPHRLRLAEAGLARLDELTEAGAAPDAVIDRLRTGLRARMGNTRARMNRDPDAERGALTERGLRGDLIAAENAELSRLFEAGTISVATRRQLQRNLDLEITRLTEGQH